MCLLVKDLYDINDPNFVGAFLYGSQNYGLNTEESDKDIIIIIKENNRTHQQLQTSSGVIKIYTLNYFLSQLERGDMECYEILYTQYRIINKAYEEIFDNFVKSFTEVLNIDRVKWALGRKLFEHLSTISWIPFNKDNSKYHRKRAYWSYRVYDQLMRIISGETLESTFIYDVSKKDRLIKIKTITNYLSAKELSKDIQTMYSIFSTLPKSCIGLSEKENNCFSYLLNNLAKNENCDNLKL